MKTTMCSATSRFAPQGHATSFAYALGLLAAFGCALSLHAAHPLDNWHSRLPEANGRQLFKAAYGSGNWVAAGTQILRSHNATNWTEILLQNVILYSVFWHPDKFFIAAGKATGQGVGTPIFTSTDATNWLGPLFVTGGDTRGVYSGTVGWLDAPQPNQVVMVGEGGLVIRSENTALVRNTGNQQPDDDLYGVAYGTLRFPTILQDRFVAVGRGGKIWNSGGGGPARWAILASITTRDLFSITWHRDRFVAVGDREIIYRRSDQTAWARATTPVDVALYGVTYSSGYFVAVGQQGTVMYSRDGDIWTTADTGLASALSGICYSGRTFVATSINDQGLVNGLGGAIVQSDPIVGFNFPPRKVTTQDVPEADPRVGKWMVEFDTELNRTYRVESTSDFLEWGLVREFTGTGLPDGTVDLSDPEPGRTFYQIRVD